MTLLRVVVDVIVALCAIGGAATGGTGTGSANPRAGAGMEERPCPVAESGGDTPPRSRLTRRRSVEETELECARDLRLLAVKPRECCEFEFDAGADPDALRGE